MHPSTTAPQFVQLRPGGEAVPLSRVSTPVHSSPPMAPKPSQWCCRAGSCSIHAQVTPTLLPSGTRCKGCAAGHPGVPRRSSGCTIEYSEIKTTRHSVSHSTSLRPPLVLITLVAMLFLCLPCRRTSRESAECEGVAPSEVQASPGAWGHQPGGGGCCGTECACAWRWALRKVVKVHEVAEAVSSPVCGVYV